MVLKRTELFLMFFPFDFFFLHQTNHRDLITMRLCVCVCVSAVVGRLYRPWGWGEDVEDEKKGEQESIKKKCKNVKKKKKKRRVMGGTIFGSAEVKPARALFLVSSDERGNNATASSSIALDARLFIRKSRAHSPWMQINQDNQYRVISEKIKGKKSAVITVILSS